MPLPTEVEQCGVAVHLEQTADPDAAENGGGNNDGVDDNA